MNARALVPFTLYAVATLAMSFTLAFGSPGCSQQGEGERCSLKNGDTDCAEGLKCESAAELGTQSDICCPVDESGAFVASDDVSCIKGSGTSSSSSGASSSGASSSSSASSSSGESSSSSGSSSSSSGAGGAGGASGAGGAGGN